MEETNILKHEESFYYDSISKINKTNENYEFYDTSQKDAIRKILAACVICIIFMILEIIAAIISNSLSLMTDASHLFCDICSFVLNLFSIYISNFQGNVDMSFGYHRAEIIGALFSIFFIWALSAYILYSSILRLFNVKIVNGYIMFITAFVSTLANIFTAYILKVHSHGFNFEHKKCHGHHNHKNHHEKNHEKNHENNDENNDENKKHYLNIYKNDITNDNKKNKYDKLEDDVYLHHDLLEKYHINKNYLNSNCNYITFDNYEKKINNDMKYNKKNINNECCNDKKKKKNQKEIQNVYNHNISDPIYDNNLQNNESDGDFHNHKNENKNLQQLNIDNISDKRSFQNPEQNKFDYKQINTNDIGDINNHYKTDITDNINCIRRKKSLHEINNINLKAAYIHALSDLIQNIGVIIASLIIWYNPKFSIVDPICSIVFCFIVFSTTISVIKEVLNVLMEGTPQGLNLIDLKNDLLEISGVIDIHDLHVWSLSIGKPALACHIVTHKNDAHIVLKYATILFQHKYNILHTTVQTDYPTNISTCETYAHLKCSNFKTVS